MLQRRKFLTCCKTLLALPFISLLSNFSIHAANAPALHTATSTFSEGQVWSYKTRAGEENSTVLINKIENHPNFGRIFHISVFGLQIRNTHSPDGVSHEIPHLPVSQATLESSLLTFLHSSQANPDYLEGYQIWKEAFESGKGGVFTINISEIIDTIEATLN